MSFFYLGKVNFLVFSYLDNINPFIFVANIKQIFILLQFLHFHVLAKRQKYRLIKMPKNSDCFQQKHEFYRQSIVNFDVRVAFQKIFWNLFHEQMFWLFFKLEKLFEKNLRSFLK